MLRYLTGNQIDIIKYDNCISKAINTRIYAHSWYLDAVCDDWDVMVQDDYTAVMPLPKRKKYGVHYIYQAPWIQQLGVFSKEKVSHSQIKKFIQKIPKKFKLIDLMLNTANGFSSKHIVPRDNFILRLEDRSYLSVQKEYSKGRKSSVKQAQKYGLKIQNVSSAKPLIDLFKENKGANLKRTEREDLALANLVRSGLQQDRLKVYEVLDSEGRLLGGAVMLYDGQRITYLFSALNEEGRSKQAMSFLIDAVIKKHANLPIFLDFEGSMVPEIASFYKSFGAIKETYFHYKKYRLF